MLVRTTEVSAMYKYGPGDPEFLDEEQPREAHAPDAFEGFWRKVAILDTIVVAGAVVLVLILGRVNSTDFGLVLAAAGIGLFGLAFLLAGWAPGGQFRMYSGPGALLHDPGNFASRQFMDPMRRPDPLAKKLALLFIASGFTLVIPGIALLVLL